MNVSMYSDLHPYECGQNCIHCRKAIEGDHNPLFCAFCRDQWYITRFISPARQLIGKADCFSFHGGQSYDLCEDGTPTVEYLDDSARGAWQVAYRYRLFGAHAGPAVIEILMVNPHEEPDEDGRNVCWDWLEWADDHTVFDDGYLLDTYHDALIEDLRIIAKECWD